MMFMAFRRGTLAAVMLGILLVQAPNEVFAQGPPGRDARCAGASGEGRGLCVAFIAQQCDVRLRRSCEIIRQLYYRATGSPIFPFELASTPTATPTPAAMPTPTPTPAAMPTATENAVVSAVGPRAGSLLIFPRVLATDERDTWIQLGNVSSSEIYAHCYYLNGAPVDPSMPPSPTNPPYWLERDYDVHLAGHQPTQWRVSTGRAVHISDPPGSAGAGLDPGTIIPVPNPFTGELRCLQTDASGVPLGGNALTGTATLVGPSEEVASYDAIAFRGLAVDGDTTLHLDGVEYESCPQAMYFLHRSDGVLFPSPTAPLTATISITVIPCTADYDHQLPVRGGLTGIFADELEVHLSAAIITDYWNDLGVDDLFVIGKNVLGDDFKLSKLTPSPSKICIGGPTPGALCSTDTDCGSSATCAVVPFLAVVETTRSGPAGKAIDIQDPHFIGSVPSAYIRLHDSFLGEAP